MPSAELVRVVYRSILRWTKIAEGVPFTLRGRDVTEVCPYVPSSTGLDLEDSKAVKALAQSGFRRHQTLKVSPVSKYGRGISIGTEPGSQYLFATSAAYSKA